MSQNIKFCFLFCKITQMPPLQNHKIAQVIKSVQFIGNRSGFLLHNQFLSQLCFSEMNFNEKEKIMWSFSKPDAIFPNLLRRKCCIL